MTYSSQKKGYIHYVPADTNFLLGESQLDFAKEISV